MIKLIANKRKLKIISFETSVIIISIIGLLGSQSRAAILALIVSLLFIIPIKKIFNIKNLIVFLLIGGSVVLITPSFIKEGVLNRITEISETKGGNTRTIIWKGYLSNWKDYLILGSGFTRHMQHGKKELFQYNKVHKLDIHNFYLYIFITFGFPGFILFLLCLLDLIKTSHTPFKTSNHIKYNKGLFINLTVVSLFGVTLLDRVLWYNFAIFLIANSLLSLQEKKNK